MAESKTVAVVPLNSSNYSTWRVQCKMVLMKDGLWSLVSGKEITRLAIIKLSIDPSLLYLISADPTDPVLVW